MATQYTIGTVLYYIQLFLMFPGIQLLCINTYVYIAGTSRKLVKIGGSSKCLEPPWLRACSVTRMENK